MTIKDGYNGKPLSIIVNGMPVTAEVWLKGEPHNKDEVLVYASINELIELRDEINDAIKAMAGL